MTQAGWPILVVFGLTVFALDSDTALGILIFGFIVAVPLKLLSADATIPITSWWSHNTERQSLDEAKQSALSTLKHRYARGNLTDKEFEHKLERLLETKTIEQIEREFERGKE